MCVDRIPTVAVLDPGDEQEPASCSPTSHKPVPRAFRIWHFFALGVGHCLFDLDCVDTSLWVVILDVLLVGTVPDDRPIVHIGSISHGDILWV
jgi:hypothetical protein